MKKLFTFLLALMASSCLWASITYELDGGKYNDYDWTCKGDICLSLEADYNTAYDPNKDWVQEVDGVILYYINNTWMTETEAKGQAATVAGFLQASTYNTNDNLKKIIESTHNDKYGWLKDVITANRSNQGLATTIDEGLYRKELSAFFLCSPKNTSYPTSSSYETTGDYKDFQPYWGQNFPNPTNPTEEVTLVAPHKTGYIFDGWYDNAEFTGSPVTKVNASTTGTLYAKWVLDGIVYELNGGEYNKHGWTCKADICLDFETDYNDTYGATKDWVKDDNGTIKYNIEGTWMTETEAKGKAANVGNFLNANTWSNDEKVLKLITITKADKYGWLKDLFIANRSAQGVSTTMTDADYRLELSAFFLCSPALTLSTATSSSYETTGDYEDFQPYWGQAFLNPEHPTEEVTLYAPVKKGYKFLGWYNNEACTGTPITKVDQNYKGTLYAKWVLDGIAYELNGGIWNEYGWEDKGDMYKAILKDINDITPIKSGTNVNTITLEKDKTNGVKLGIPTYWNDLTVLLTHETFNTKWGWLVAYMDAVCSTQSRTKPSTDQAALRYNLSAFFMDDHYASWPYSADYTTAGKVEAFQTTWGQSFPGIEHPTESTVLHIAYKPRHTFEGWYDNAECTGAAITTVDQTYAGTLYAKWSIAPITYNLNGGQYNQYGWKSKKDVYDDFIADWNTYSGTTRKTAQYEDQLGVGKSNGGIPTTITTVSGVNHQENLAAMFTNPTYSAKWGWLAIYIDAVAVQQGKTQPTSNANTLTFSLGNFFGEDNNHSTDYIGAVDFTGDERYLVSAQRSCSFTLPNPTYPTSEVTINNPTKEGYIFDGWYANADFSGAKVTKVNADTKGTLYAKWKEDAYSRTVTNGNYGTICLPKGSKQTSGAIFYELACKDAQYVYLEQVTILEAGVPYIFKATSNTLKVVYNTTEVATAGYRNGLYGTFVDIQDAATSDPNNVLEGNYLLVSNTIKKCGVNCKVLENRAYIKLEEIPNSASAAPGRNRVSMKYEGENAATALDNINEDSNITPALQGTYDIMGRKLTEPSTTGFYIVNGKKVIIMK